MVNKPYPYYSSAINSDAYDFSCFHSHVCFLLLFVCVCVCVFVVVVAVFNGEEVRCVCVGGG